MVTFKKLIEIIDDSIKKIRGITENGDYCEVRLKGKCLDIKCSKQEGYSMRCIYRTVVEGDMSIAEIIELLGITFI
jgi:hypothetical protein